MITNKIFPKNGVFEKLKFFYNFITHFRFELSFNFLYTSMSTRVIGIFSMYDGSEEIRLQVGDEVEVHNFPTKELLQNWINEHINFGSRADFVSRRRKQLEEKFSAAIQKQGFKSFCRTFVGAHDEEEYIITPEEFFHGCGNLKLQELWHHEHETFFKRFYEEHLHELEPSHVVSAMARLAGSEDISPEAVKAILSEQ